MTNNNAKLGLVLPILTTFAVVSDLPLLLSLRSTLNEADAAAIADAVWDTELETGYTARQMMRIMFAALAGNREGLGTATERYYGRDGVTPRVTFTPTDASGNGTTVVDGA